MHHQPRSGATLLEVLIAIFVAGIGLLAMLALFPVGAASMAQAIKENRCTQASANADAMSRFMNLRQDANLTNTLYQGDGVTQANGTQWPNMATAGYTGPSYPVYVDPLGTTIGAGALGTYPLTPPKSPGIQRTSVSFVSTFTDYLKWFRLLDDISFGNNGLPVTQSGFIEREGRYTWAYLLQRPNWQDPSIVNAQVVVYSGRSSAVAGETSYHAADFARGDTVFQIYLDAADLPPGQDVPAVRPGGWILDSTVVKSGGTIPDPHGDFYRVINITQITKLNQSTNQLAPVMVLELNTPVKHSASNGEGVLTVMDNVAEVFQKGP
jgi:hypothetical protein